MYEIKIIQDSKDVGAFVNSKQEVIDFIHGEIGWTKKVLKSEINAHEDSIIFRDNKGIRIWVWYTLNENTPD